MKSTQSLPFLKRRLLGLACLAVACLTGAPANAASTTIVISQVYGGGGNSGATYKNDFIELHNISSGLVSVAGGSVQYASATGTSWQVTPLSGSIPAGGYYLVQEASGGTPGAALPTADATGTINLSGTTGKVALVNSTTALSGAVSSGPTIVDMIGYGAANAYEGSGPAPALTNTTADLRNNYGTTDTDNNASDFTAGTPAPRNSATSPYPVPSATQVRVETAADGSGSAVGTQSVPIGGTVTAYSISRTATNGFVANSAATWALTSKMGGVTDTDLVPASDGKSAVFTAHAGGSAIIHAAVIGLTSVDSGTITVNAVPTPPTGTGSAVSGAAGQTEALSVVVTPGTNPTSSGITVTADLSAIGGSSAQLFTAGPSNTFTWQTAVVAGTTLGAKTILFTVADAQNRSTTGSLTFTVLDRFTIFHVNDTHARVTPHKWIIPKHNTTNGSFEDVGGAAFLAGEMLTLVGGNPNSLVIDGGDISEGNPIGDMNGNGAMTQFYALLANKLKALRGRGMDAVVVGNHDVRDVTYITNLQQLNAPTAQNQTPVPVISINICAHGTQTPYFNPYTIVTVNGTKIGILGYTTQESEVGASLSTTIDVVNCDWTSADNTKIHIADYVNQLRNGQGCDIVILAAHVGHSALVDPTAPLLVDDGTAKLPEIAVTGHWHTWTDTVWQPEMLNFKTIFTESCSFMKYIGELNVDSTGRYISSMQHVIRDSDITPDADVQALIDGLKATYNANAVAAQKPQVDDIIGYTANDLLLDNKMKWWSAEEYPWSGNNTAGQWICDAMQWEGVQLFGQCDLSIEAGGGVRADIPAGPVTFLQIYETFPWNDDTFCRVNMTGQEIINFLKATTCDAGFSSALDVTAYDGVPSNVQMNGQPIVLNHTYTVCINNYMYAHPPTGWTWSDTNPLNNAMLCRDGIVDYMQKQHATLANAYASGGPRYHLNTEFSGGFRAVVTMMNDNDSKPSYDDAFIRLLSATPETLARLGSPQVPTNLVNADGSVNPSNRLSEAELYRSYLGFKTGALKPGDIIETWGKGSFYGGDPEFVDQEGIYADGVEFNIVGHDDSLIKPAFMPSIGAFWNDAYKNHYVKFLAKKTAASSVADQTGQTIQIMDVTAYAAKTLPGNVGDYLLLTGIPTMESYSMRFRCDTANVATGITSFPAASTVTSSVNPLPPGATGSPLTLTATANAAGGSSTWFLPPVADAQVESGYPTSNYGTTNNLYVESSTTSYGNERAWVKFDLSSLPANASITGATLQLWCWSAGSADLPTELRDTSDDSWTETGITWNSQPTLDSTGSSIDVPRTLTAGTSNLWYTWDITSFAQTKFANDKLVSLVVKPVIESASSAVSFAFDSKEYGSNAPVLQVTTAATGPVATVASVQYFYRFSTDNTNWGGWTAVPGDPATTAPYTVSFGFPSGYGYYEFYSIATDSNGLAETPPLAADAAVHYSAAPVYATVGIGGLDDVFNGSTQPVSVTTNPPGMTVAITYNGSATAPTHPGVYDVSVTATGSNFTDTTKGTLTIDKAAQTIDFGTPAPLTVGGPDDSLMASSTSGMPVSFASSNPAVATVSGTQAHAVAAGTATITANQSGNTDYLAAPPVSQDLLINPADTGSSDSTPIPEWALIGLVVAVVAVGLRYLLPRRANGHE